MQEYIERFKAALQEGDLSPDELRRLNHFYTLLESGVAKGDPLMFGRHLLRGARTVVNDIRCEYDGAPVLDSIDSALDGLELMC